MSSVGNLIRSIEEERLRRMRKRLDAFEIQGLRTGARHGDGPY